MRRVTMILLAALFAVHSGVWSSEKVRLSVGAGPLYPFESETLLRVIREACASAAVPARNQRLVACIAPHGGYGLSGAIAGQAFNELTPGQYSRVIVLAPSHFADFELCSIVSARAYVTPLGIVPIDLAAVDRLNFSPLISTRGLRYKRSSFLSESGYVKLHEVEYSIEAVLPFLQERLGSFLLVPILVGRLSDGSERLSTNRIKSIAKTIRKVIDERTLIVVSTDFTHYGAQYQYMPSSFLGQERASIEALDREAYALVVARDHEGFEAYLARTGNRICGRNALRVFMRLLDPGVEGAVLGTSLSMDKLPGVSQSVSYAAINFYDPSKTPLEAPLWEPIFHTNEVVVPQTQEP